MVTTVVCLADLSGGGLERLNLAVWDDLFVLTPDELDVTLEVRDVASGVCGERLLEPLEARVLDLTERRRDDGEAVRLRLGVVGLELGGAEETLEGFSGVGDEAP